MLKRHSAEITLIIVVIIRTLMRKMDGKGRNASFYKFCVSACRVADAGLSLLCHQCAPAHCLRGPLYRGGM